MLPTTSSRRSSKRRRKRGHAALDLSLLTDGLEAEREQGITIDVAYRYFATARRKFIIADTPGHEQYTRNMVTGASTADVAIAAGRRAQGRAAADAPPRRRSRPCCGIRHLVVAVNKMDLVDYARDRFESIRADFASWIANRVGASVDVHFIPISALEGDNVVDRGQQLAWYDGPTLVELLERAPSEQLNTETPARLPVQWVCRPAQSDFRGYAGRLEAGTLAVGDEVLVLPGGLRSRVTRIAIGETELPVAVAGQSVMVSLADERDVSRGDTIVRADQPAPAQRQQLTATLCWLSTTPLSTARSYVLQHTARSVKSRVTAVEGRLDIHSLAWAADGNAVELNDIVRVQLKTQQPLVADAYRSNRDTGSFILIDEATNDTVAAGLID